MTTYKVLNIHPSILKLWEDNKYIPNDLQADAQEMTFFAQVGQPKTKVIKTQSGKEAEIVLETEEQPDRPIKRKIEKMYRTPNSLFYSEFFEGETWRGKRATHSRLVGKYRLPTLEKDRDRASGRVTIVGMGDAVDTYEIPFPNSGFIDPSTGNHTTLDELYKLASPDCIFYVKTNTRTYALRGISLEEFSGKSFTDLVYYGEKGSWPEQKETTRKRRSDES